MCIECYCLIAYKDTKLHTCFLFCCSRIPTTAYIKFGQKTVVTDGPICPKIGNFEPPKTGTRPEHSPTFRQFTSLCDTLCSCTLVDTCSTDTKNVLILWKFQPLSWTHLNLSLLHKVICIRKTNVSSNAQREHKNSSLWFIIRNMICFPIQS